MDKSIYLEELYNAFSVLQIRKKSVFFDVIPISISYDPATGMAPFLYLSICRLPQPANGQVRCCSDYLFMNCYVLI